ncbi:MAG: hypothetical protein RLN78_01880 [Phycisphaerales bacterium]
MSTTFASMTLCQTLAQDDASAIINALGDNLVVAIVFGVGGLVAVIAILFGTLTGFAGTKEREKTKRELAAYVAEGSMTPSDAERILRADKENE